MHHPEETHESGKEYGSVEEKKSAVMKRPSNNRNARAEREKRWKGQRRANVFSDLSAEAALRTGAEISRLRNGVPQRTQYLPNEHNDLPSFRSKNEATFHITQASRHFSPLLQDIMRSEISVNVNLQGYRKHSRNVSAMYKNMQAFLDSEIKLNDGMGDTMEKVERLQQLVNNSRSAVNHFKKRWNTQSVHFAVERILKYLEEMDDVTDRVVVLVKDMKDSVDVAIQK